jgi:hypothetical protein
MVPQILCGFLEIVKQEARPCPQIHPWTPILVSFSIENVSFLDINTGWKGWGSNILEITMMDLNSFLFTVVKI